MYIQNVKTLYNGALLHKNAIPWTYFSGVPIDGSGSYFYAFMQLGKSCLLYALPVQ
jgi:hypothetical protein